MCCCGLLWVENKRQNQTTEGSCLKCECTSLWPYGRKKTYLVATQVFFPKAVNMSQASFTVGDFSQLGEVNETLSKDKTLTEDYYNSKVLLEKNTRVMIDYKIVQMERPMDIENLTVKATIKYRGVKIHAVNGVITEI